jgi:NADH:ubiquinone oxidoreductase subunit K
LLLNQFLVLGAILFAIGVYGVLARRNGVMVLMSIELILNAVNINFIAFAAWWGSRDPATCVATTTDAGVAQECAVTAATTGQVFGLFIIAVAAAEVGVGLAIVLMLFRNRRSIDIDEMDLLKG